MVTRIWTRNALPNTRDLRRHRLCQLRSQLRKHPQHRAATKPCKYVFPILCPIIKWVVFSMQRNYSNIIQGLELFAPSKSLRAIRKSNLSWAFVRAYSHEQSSDSHLIGSVCAVCVHDTHIRWASRSRFSPLWIFERSPDMADSGFE
jgi:hypothetical protein